MLWTGQEKDSEISKIYLIKLHADQIILNGNKRLY